MDTDAAVFAEFYSSAKDDCLRVVLATVRDRQTAEDLAAEAFTRAWASWRKVSRHPAPRAWVVRTALNTHRYRAYGAGAAALCAAAAISVASLTPGSASTSGTRDAQLAAWTVQRQPDGTLAVTIRDMLNLAGL